MITPHLIAMFAAARTVAAGPPPPAPTPSPAAMALAHLDTSFANSGTDGSYTITPDPASSITTAQAKFGTGSATGDFGGDVAIAVSPTVTFSGDWCVDWWVRGSVTGLRIRHPDGNQEWTAFVSTTNAVFDRLDDLGDQVYEALGSTYLTADTWTHVEFSRTSGTIRLFVGGVLSASQSDTTSLEVSSVSTYGDPYLDEWRVVRGSGAGHTSGFTPPTSAYG